MSVTARIVVRAARREDVPDILRLIRALAAFEREPDAVAATEAMLDARLFGASPKVFALIAEADGHSVGLAMWFYTFSTWTGRHGLYLEDLFVEPAARGRGVARALLATLARTAQSEDCARIDWAVLDWNKAAQAAYRALGARHNAAWEPWRLEGEALERLAGTAEGPTT